MENNPTPGFSFGFKAKKESSVLKTKSALGEHVEVKEEVDFVKAVDDQQIKSVNENVKPSGPLVIPCIKKNKWKQLSDSEFQGSVPKEKLTKKDNDPCAEVGSDLSSEAAKALIQEAQRRAEDDQEQDATDPDFAIPLLMQNKVRFY